MEYQLRHYRLEAGVRDEFVALWREQVVPAREALGFEVVGAWEVPGENEFVWIVGHPAPDGFAAAEKAYYESPQRAAITPEPRTFIAEATLRVMRPV